MDTTPAAPESELGSILLDLAAEAFDRGELATAEDRYRRVLRAIPESPGAHLGLGRIALAREQAEVAKKHFEIAGPAESKSAAVLLGLADVARLTGDREDELRHLRGIIRQDPFRSHVHARMAALTGLAPSGAERTSQGWVNLAEAHPYDPRAILRAARAFSRDGQMDKAIRLLQRILWLGDIHPPSTREAIRRLRLQSETWAARRIVHVHVYADDLARAGDGWRFRVRDTWRAVSIALAEIIDVQFVPMSVTPVSPHESSTGLETIHAAILTEVHPLPARGILAGFTGRVAPRVAGYNWKVGIAQILGRHATIRISPDELPVRVLAHEILHLYGAIHVAEGVDSLMNPKGEKLVLDRYNLDIVRATQRRVFGRGDFDRNVLPHIDLEQTTAAYLKAIQANLKLREMGVQQALKSARTSRYVAMGQLLRAQKLDPHLAEISRVVADMLLAQGRRVEALVMLDTATKLYGPGTVRSRESGGRADRLRQVLRRDLL